MKARGRLSDIIKSHRLFWVICGVLLLLNLVFYLSYVTTESHRIAQLQTRFQAERKKVSSLRKQEAAIDHHKALQASWQAFEKSLPGKIQSPERIEQLKQLLGQYRLATDDLAFRSEPVSGADLVRFTTALRASGAYGDVKRFIGALQGMQGLFCIRQLELQQVETGGRLEMSMELSAYFSEKNES